MKSETMNPSRAKDSKGGQDQGADSDRGVESITDIWRQIPGVLDPGIFISGSINYFISSQKPFLFLYIIFCNVGILQKDKDYQCVKKTMDKLIVMRPQFQNCLWTFHV